MRTATTALPATGDPATASLATGLWREMAQTLRQLDVRSLRSLLVDLASLEFHDACTISDDGDFTRNHPEWPVDSEFPGMVGTVSRVSATPPHETLAQRVGARSWLLGWRIDRSLAIIAEARFRVPQGDVSRADVAMLRLICSALVREKQVASTPLYEQGEASSVGDGAASSVSRLRAGPISARAAAVASQQTASAAAVPEIKPASPGARRPLLAEDKTDLPQFSSLPVDDGGRSLFRTRRMSAHDQPQVDAPPVSRAASPTHAAKRSESQAEQPAAPARSSLAAIAKVDTPPAIKAEAAGEPGPGNISRATHAATAVDSVGDHIDPDQYPPTRHAAADSREPTRQLSASAALPSAQNDSVIVVASTIGGNKSPDVASRLPPTGTSSVAARAVTDADPVATGAAADLALSAQQTASAPAAPVASSAVPPATGPVDDKAAGSEPPALSVAEQATTASQSAGKTGHAAPATAPAGPAVLPAASSPPPTKVAPAAPAVAPLAGNPTARSDPPAPLSEPKAAMPLTFDGSPSRPWSLLSLLALATLLVCAIAAFWGALVAIPRANADHQADLYRQWVIANETIRHHLSEALATGDYGEVQNALTSFASLGYYEVALVGNTLDRVVAQAGEIPNTRIGDKLPRNLLLSARTIDLASGSQNLGQLFILQESRRAESDSQLKKIRWAALLAGLLSVLGALLLSWKIYRAFAEEKRKARRLPQSGEMERSGARR